MTFDMSDTVLSSAVCEIIKLRKDSGLEPFPGRDTPSEVGSLKLRSAKAPGKEQNIKLHADATSRANEIPACRADHHSEPEPEDPVLKHFSQKDTEWWIDGREVEWDNETAFLGEGSVSYVFKATWKTRAVAVKMLRLEPSAEADDKLPDYSLDLMDELTVVSKHLDHPNIVEFYGAGITTVDDIVLPVILYEYVSGGSLHDLFNRKAKELGEPWRPVRVVSFSWCYQLLLALTFLHENDTPVAHRDIKPANILVSSDLKTVKLADFSLAHPLSRPCTVDTAGSMRYMAPEATSAPYDLVKADVFSAAITCWSLTHGGIPYRRISDPKGALLLVQKGNRPVVERGAAFAQILSAAWAQEPGDRPTARAFAEQMGELLAVQQSTWRKEVMRTVKSTFSKAKTAILTRSVSV